MASKYTIRVVVLLLLISLQLIKLCHGSGVHTSIHCLEFEREALLGFAKGFNQTEYPFSSWAGKDCCRWGGVYCDSTIGHIIKLVVRGVSHGKMNQSLLGLKHLNYLALEGDINIPPFIGDFEHPKCEKTYKMERKQRLKKKVIFLIPDWCCMRRSKI